MLLGQYSEEQRRFFVEFDWIRESDQLSNDSRGGKVYVGREIEDDLNFIPDMQTTNLIYDKAFGRVSQL